MVLRISFCFGCPVIQINADQPLNFVIFVNHDHAVSAWGIKSDRFQEINPTRNIDSLGSTGYSFINAFCSNGSSAPGSATMLTGKFAHQHGLLVNGQRFNPNQPTLPKALKQVGYESALFGRWDLKTEPADFDHWEVLQDSSEFFNPTILSPSEKDRLRVIQLISLLTFSFSGSNKGMILKNLSSLCIFQRNSEAMDANTQATGNI